ncbi:hypothetical protein [Marinomonas ostreistagni]|uniref:hypothetical protein n=1 Tax=Marinomonas ostreistagni TaxID=359209 RepID=UPI001950498D|nr:hypothetical protein [Marinomonas ostreistagni]MBM6550999.1 hypothetical protein [Marinomonas ostreistagni]
MMKQTVAGLCLAALAAPSMAQDTTVVGKAYRLDSDQLVYVEKHQYLEDGRHQVSYESPQGEVFARKTLDYSVSEQAPTFTQTNDLIGERIEVSNADGKLKLRYRASDNGKVFQKRFERSKRLLVDAGFDKYVKNNWQALTEGKPFEIQYLVPSETTTVSFKVSQTDCLANTPASAKCFSIAPQSWWVSLAVDPLTVAYDPNTRNLVRFTGRGNIANADGDYQSVDIHYQYPDSQATGE